MNASSQHVSGQHPNSCPRGFDAEAFSTRHLGPGPEERDKMLAACGYGSLDELMSAAVPASIRTSEPLDLPPAMTRASNCRRLGMTWLWCEAQAPIRLPRGRLRIYASDSSLEVGVTGPVIARAMAR
jgi:hypothetical protein